MKVRWRAWSLVALLFLHSVVASPLNRRRHRRQALPQQFDLEPADQYIYNEEIFGPDLADRGPRDKRKVQILLNILFWKINTLLDLKTRLLARISERQRLGGRFFTTTTTPDPTEDDVPEFDSNRVMLDIPGELFGTAFSVVTDVSKVVGDVILNSARRTQKFVEGVKAAVARSFGYKITALTSSSSISKSTGEEEDGASSDDS